MNLIGRIRAAIPPPEATLNSADLETRLAVGLLQSIAVAVLLWAGPYFAFVLPFFVVRKAVAGGMVAAMLSGALVALYLLSRCAPDSEGLRSPPALNRQVRRAAWVVTAVNWLVTVSYILLDGGIRSRALFLVLALTLSALILLGHRVAKIGLALCIGLFLILAVLERSGIYLPQYFPNQPLAVWYVAVLVTALTAFPVMQAFTTLRDAILRACESEEAMRTILETAPDSVFIVNASGCIMEVNRSFLQQLRCSREE